MLISATSATLDLTPKPLKMPIRRAGSSRRLGCVFACRNSDKSAFNEVALFYPRHMNRHFLSIPVLLMLFGPPSSLLSAGEGSYALFLSKDHGRSWSGADIGTRSDTRINAVASTKTSIIAGTDAGIIISTNSAKSWHPAAIHNPGRARVTCIAHLRNRIFAGTSEGLLLTSSDDGANWQSNPSFPRHWIRSLHVMGQTLYVGTDADHVYGSSNQGETWNHLSAGLPPQSQVFALTSIDDRLFAGLYAKGLYTWSEADHKWFRIGASADIRPLALAATGGNLVAGHNPGGIHWSDDLGQNWKRWAHADAPTPPRDGGDSFPSLDSLLFTSPDSSLDAPIWEMAADAKVAITGAGDGIYYSTDRARTWSRATTGLPANSNGIAFFIRPDMVLAAVIHKPGSCAESKSNRGEK